MQETALTGSNAAYIAEIFARYRDNPESVDQSWAAFFADLSADEQAILGEMRLSALKGTARRVEQERLSALGANGKADGVSKEGAAPTTAEARVAVLDSMRALMLIRAHRVRGHLVCDLDPLGLKKEGYHPELDPKTYGFTEADMDREIFLDHVLGYETATLREIVRTLKETYCGHIGVQFMHIQDPDQKNWIQERIERIRNHTKFTPKGKRAILERLTAAESLEQYLHKKYVGTKRFGLDGGEALVPAMEQIMKRGGQMGLEEINVGMAHRGRLNVLTNVMGKSFIALFSEFQGNSANPEDVQGSGDVKYHLGTSSDRDFDGNVIHLSLTANPSHLEAVNPVVVGKVRAKQEQRGDRDARRKVMGVLLHGDAAFAGQGLVAETLMISELAHYRTGGTIHIVINNQIGFTTAPDFGRFTPHPTDVALHIQAPIFHVNGDDPEAVCHVARIATEFRQAFGKDVVINLVCYRRYGHNEGDEPAFTQPLMYRAIADHPSTREIYARRLAREGLITEEDAAQIKDDFMERLENDFEKAEHYKPNKADWLEGKWSGFEVAPADERRGRTAVSAARLKKIGQKISTVPDDFNIHSKIKRQLKTKAKMFETGEGIDWATAEALAFGTLLDEGYHVRLSGQDCGRGTFSQRHAILYDQDDGSRYIPLAHLKEDQPLFEVIDSPLSEAAVMGFEYGYSLAEPNALVMWEAQFGDFVNGAQVIIDQFISSAESKWLRMSGLTLLLPHGYEGQGPEHSSARLERFLQLCGQDNMQVANCTSPANYFHILRRQIHRKFRKPLVLMTPKSLLRHKLCVSPLAMFSGKSEFHRILWDDGENLLGDDKIRRVVLCSGKVYYDLFEEREARGIRDIQILRLEQLYPFPEEPLAKELARFPQADVIWCQEEPENMGAWSFVDRRVEAVLQQIKHKSKRPVYVGRAEAASPATGLLRRHKEEQAALVDAALTIK